MVQGTPFVSQKDTVIFEEGKVYEIKPISNYRTSICLNIGGIGAVAPTGAVNMKVAIGSEPISATDEKLTLQPEDTNLLGFYRLPVEGLPDFVKFEGNGGDVGTREITAKGLIIKEIIFA